MLKQNPQKYLHAHRTFPPLHMKHPNRSRRATAEKTRVLTAVIPTYRGFV